MSDGLLHRGASPTTLGVVRSGVFAAWLGVVVPDRLSFLAELPPSLFRPTGAFALVPRSLWTQLLQPDRLALFQVALIALVAACALGVRPWRPIAVITVAGLAIHQGLLRQYTFFNHEELALLLCSGVLALLPSADGFSWPKRSGMADRNSGVYGDGMFVLTVVLVFPYTAIAAHRIAHGVPAVFTGRSVPYWMTSLTGLDRDGWRIALWLVDRPALVVAAKAAFVVTTAFELLAPLILVLPRFRRVWLAVVIAFHALNWFLLNLFFWQNIVLILLLALDLDSVLARVHHTRLWSMQARASE